MVVPTESKTAPFAESAQDGAPGENPPPSAQDAEDGAPEKARAHGLKPACGRQACAMKERTQGEGQRKVTCPARFLRRARRGNGELSGLVLACGTRRTQALPASRLRAKGTWKAREWGKCLRPIRSRQVRRNCCR